MGTCEIVDKNTPVDFSKRKSKSIKQKIGKIEKELESIETSNYNEIDMNRKRKLEQELDEIYENKTKVHMLGQRPSGLKRENEIVHIFYVWRISTKLVISSLK